MADEDYIFHSDNEEDAPSYPAKRIIVWNRAWATQTK